MDATNGPVQKSLIARIGGFLWGLFFLLVFFGGMAVIAFFAGGDGMIDYVRAKTWEENVCTVRSARMVFDSHGIKSRSNQLYRIQTSYDFVVDGQRYQGHRYSLDDKPSSNFRKPARAEKYLQRNPNVTCYFNPDNPSEAVIDRSFQGSLLAALLPLTFIVLFGGLMLINRNRGGGAATKRRSTLK